MTSLSFCLPGKDFLPPSFLKGYRIPGWQDLSFQDLEYIAPLPSGLQSFCWKI